MKLSWSKAESKAQDRAVRAEYCLWPVLRQELKGKEEEYDKQLFTDNCASRVASFVSDSRVSCFCIFVAFFGGCAIVPCTAIIHD